MTERTKRIASIAAYLGALILFTAAVIYLFFGGSSPAPTPEEEVTTPDTPSTTGGLTTSPTGTPGTITSPDTQSSTSLPQADNIAQGGVTQTVELTTSAVVNPVGGGDGTAVQFYSPSDEKFYRMTADGSIEALSDRTFPSVEKATWNQNAEKAILEFPDGSNIVYDFENEQQVTLPSHWEDFDFSPTTDELSAKSIGIDPENRWLVISNSNGSNVKSVQTLGENEAKVQVNWSPNNQVIAFSDTAEGLGSFDRRTIVPLGKAQENFKGLTVEGLGFKSTWSPDGKKLLYSVSGSYSNYRPLLWVVSATSSTMGENRQSIALNTWADKCTFATESTLYCAVPKGLPPNAGLQPSAFATLPDSLYEVDINSGTTKLIAIPAQETVMTDLLVSPDGSTLYYKNGQTDHLEYIKLN